MSDEEYAILSEKRIKKFFTIFVILVVIFITGLNLALYVPVIARENELKKADEISITVLDKIQTSHVSGAWGFIHSTDEYQILVETSEGDKQVLTTSSFKQYGECEIGKVYRIKFASANNWSLLGQGDENEKEEICDGAGK